MKLSGKGMSTSREKQKSHSTSQFTYWYEHEFAPRPDVYIDKKINTPTGYLEELIVKMYSTEKNPSHNQIV